MWCGAVCYVVMRCCALKAEDRLFENKDVFGFVTLVQRAVNVNVVTFC